MGTIYSLSIEVPGKAISYFITYQLLVSDRNNWGLLREALICERAVPQLRAGTRTDPVELRVRLRVPRRVFGAWENGSNRRYRLRFPNRLQ